MRPGISVGNQHPPSETPLEAEYDRVTPRYLRDMWDRWGQLYPPSHRYSCCRLHTVIRLPLLYWAYYLHGVMAWSDWKALPAEQAGPGLIARSRALSDGLYWRVEEERHSLCDQSRPLHRQAQPERVDRSHSCMQLTCDFATPQCARCTSHARPGWSLLGRSWTPAVRQDGSCSRA